MPHPFPYTQVRIARSTLHLEKVIDFYKNGLGLPQIGHFEGHEGYSGVMFGLPGVTYHIESTEHESGTPLPAPSPDQLLVFYLPSWEERNRVVQRLLQMGYETVEPENPYWKTHGITVKDPDQYAVVLMDVAGFKQGAGK